MSTMSPSPGLLIYSEQALPGCNSSHTVDALKIQVDYARNTHFLPLTIKVMKMTRSDVDIYTLEMNPIFIDLNRVWTGA